MSRRTFLCMTPHGRGSAGWVLFGLAALVTPPALPQADIPSRERAVLIPIKGELSRGHLHLIRRGVRQARSSSAKAVVFEIDSPGGEVSRMEEIDDAMHQGRTEGLETVALVVNQANSAAAFLAIGCDYLYMTPASQIGSARPIQIGLPGIVPTLPGMGEAETEKFLSAFRGSFRRQAEAQGRNPAIAEAMVDDRIELVLVEKNGEPEVMRRSDFANLEDSANARLIEVVCESGELLNLTANEALRYRFIDGIVETRAELASHLEIPEQNLIELSPTWSEGLAEFLDQIGLVLFFLGCLFLFVEFKIPGFGLPGILGVACFALLLFGKYLAGLAEIPEILLVVIGLGLIAVELFVFPGTLVAGVVGGLAVLVGLFLSFQSFVIPEQDWQFELMGNNALWFSGALIASLIGLFVLARFLPGVPLLGRLVLDPVRGGTPGLRGGAAAVDDVDRWADIVVGAEGLADSDLRPAGKIQLGLRRLDAVAEGTFIERGTTVRVVRVEGNRIVVRAVGPAGGPVA
ncbi:MAG: NfeD family protein [Planctomycetota bacterium]